MLDRFAKAKQAEIVALLTQEAGSGLPEPYAKERPSFSAALRSRGPGAVIAEYKRASPSKGVINLNLGPADVAAGYARGGAACMSVLTEEKYFQGSLGYLDDCVSAGLPLLRKDFILHPVQIRRTAATPASAVLLIARMVDEDELAILLSLCRELGLEAVTEVFDSKDLTKARTAGAEIIQVNNRDLDTLDVSLDISRQLVSDKADGELWISASGITQGSQIVQLAGAGFDAVLVGTFLMAGDDPGAALTALIRDSAS